jgi:hypothetical protein
MVGWAVCLRVIGVPDAVYIFNLRPVRSAVSVPGHLLLGAKSGVIVQDFIMPFLWLLVGILGLWKQLSDLRNNDKSTDGGVAGEISAAWERLNKPLLERIDALSVEVQTMKSERERHLRFIGELIRGAKIHLDQLEGVNVKSRWQPSDELMPLFQEILNAQAVGDETPTQPDNRKPPRKNGGLGMRR